MGAHWTATWLTLGDEVRRSLMFIGRMNFPRNRNLLACYSANDDVLRGPRFHELPNTGFGTIEGFDSPRATISPIGVDPENVE